MWRLLGRWLVRTRASNGAWASSPMSSVSIRDISGLGNWFNDLFFRVSSKSRRCRNPASHADAPPPFQSGGTSLSGSMESDPIDWFSAASLGSASGKLVGLLWGRRRTGPVSRSSLPAR